jgi:hypothetical protein
MAISRNHIVKNFGGWIAQLKSVDLDPHSYQDKQLEKFFDLLFDLARQYAEQNVPLYGAKMLRYSTFTQESWKIAEANLLNLCRVSPSCLPTVGEVLINVRADKISINSESVREFLVTMLIEHGGRLNHAEVAWCLFIAKGLSIKLPDDAVKGLNSIDSSVIALLLHD